MHNEKTTINNVTNPTQINVGTQENSVQTIAKALDNAVKHPKESNLFVLDFLLGTIKHSFSTIFLVLRAAIAPIVFCYYVGFFTVSLFIAHNTFEYSLKVPILLAQDVLGLIFRVASIHVTFYIMNGFFLLCVILTVLNLYRIIEKQD